MKRHLPNTLTCLNLFSGCVGVLFALDQAYTYAFYCILASGIFDFFDGMVARALHVKSAIGKELDSLADMVSFGFLPGIILYMLLQASSPTAYLPYLGFVVTVFSALRLAKFNVDSRQTSDFIGLNTPMNTFFVISLPFIFEQFPSLHTPALLIGIIAVVSYLLVAEIRLFSMKMSSLSWQDNKYKYVFLGLSALLLIFLQFAALPLVLVLYILFSKLHFASES